MSNIVIVKCVLPSLALWNLMYLMCIESLVLKSIHGPQKMQESIPLPFTHAIDILTKAYFGRETFKITNSFSDEMHLKLFALQCVNYLLSGLGRLVPDKSKIHRDIFSILNMNKLNAVFLAGDIILSRTSSELARETSKGKFLKSILQEKVLSCPICKGDVLLSREPVQKDDLAQLHPALRDSGILEFLPFGFVSNDNIRCKLSHPFGTYPQITCLPALLMLLC